ncbi:hypothetical protein MNBD_ALPHA08-1804, partial [hydrothermal vent metagenome]
MKKILAVVVMSLTLAACDNSTDQEKAAAAAEKAK